MAYAGSGLASGLAVLLGPPEPRKGTWVHRLSQRRTQIEKTKIFSVICILFFFVHRFQRSSTLALVHFTPRSLGTGQISPQTSMSLWRASCSPRLPASPLAPRWCSQGCVWHWPLWHSIPCLRPGLAQWQRWCECFRRTGEEWTDGHAALHC